MPREPSLLYSVVNYFLLSDAETLTMNANMEEGEYKKVKMTLKASNLVRDKLKEQLKHINCLIPPSDVTFHYRGSNGKVYSSKQSSSNEGLHKDCNRTVFSGIRVGLQRDDQGMWTFLDDRDERQNVVRRNAEEHFPTNIESKAVANSLAEDAGYETPFKDVSLPSGPPTNELFGFELMKDSHTSTGGEATTPNDDVEEEDDNEGGEDSDEEYDENESSTEQEQKMETLQAAFDAVLSRGIDKRGKSFDSFYKFTGVNPTVPFDMDEKDSRAKEELKIFRDMSRKYNRNVNPGHRDGYNNFKEEWNQLTGRRREEHVLDPNVIAIYAKSVKQLQDCYDTLQYRSREAIQAHEAGMRRQEGLNRVMHEIQRKTPAPIVATAAPQAFTTQHPWHVPTGFPFVLNPDISMMGVGRKHS
mmetsp:Transcript_38152/g.114070  ORF Transcript_38152/g.114070 Transcript_38152/m.114070 type:complete len:415 (+) Transcript_38152:451-1695(+)